jgi:hypothetical protein
MSRPVELVRMPATSWGGRLRHFEAWGRRSRRSGALLLGGHGASLAACERSRPGSAGARLRQPRSVCEELAKHNEAVLAL